MSDLDFKAASHDGYGDDWPISHAGWSVLRKVERYVGISGTAEGLPQLPDSIFLPGYGDDVRRRNAESRGWKQFGRTLTIGRAAVLTKATTAALPAITAGHANRAARPFPISVAR